VAGREFDLIERCGAGHRRNMTARSRNESWGTLRSSIEAVVVAATNAADAHNLSTYERQVEYWTSRGIEDFFLDNGFEVPVFPLTQLTEAAIPSDFLFP
jgi:hypothetical protein